MRAAQLWDTLPSVPSWIDTLRARPKHARDVLFRAGYSYDGPDLVLETHTATPIIVRASGVFVRARPGTDIERYMTDRPEKFVRQCPRKTSPEFAEFEVLPLTIFGSLYYQPECEYHHGFFSLADKILSTDRVICKHS
jgi:hypothetical protein